VAHRFSRYIHECHNSSRARGVECEKLIPSWIEVVTESLVNQKSKTLFMRWKFVNNSIKKKIDDVVEF
jgi:hypothetical protein